MSDRECVELAVRVLADIPDSAERFAGALLARARDRLSQFAADVAPACAAMTGDRVMAGWTPRTLAHVVRHRDDSVGVGVLAGWLRADPYAVALSRFGAWKEQLDDLPPTVEPDLTTVPGLAAALRVMAALAMLPPILPASCADCEDDDEDEEWSGYKRTL